MVEYSSPKIQIIPWVHSVAASNHRDVIKKLQGLPKNSVLFFEDSGLGIDFLSGLPQSVRRGKFNGYFSYESRGLIEKIKKDLEKNPRRDFLSDLNDAALASIEVLEEARRRNMHIVGLDTLVSRMYTNNSLSRLIHEPSRNAELHFIQSCFYRDGVFAEQIGKFLVRAKQKNFYCICGAAHVPGLLEELHLRGVPFDVSTRFLGAKAKKEFFESFRLNSTGRKYFNAGNWDALWEMAPLLLKEANIKMDYFKARKIVREKVEQSVHKATVSKRIKNEKKSSIAKAGRIK